MKEILEFYIDTIEDFNTRMKKKYKFDVNPWRKAGILFDKKGVIDGYEYWFHGSGCTLIKDSTIFDYDVTLLTKKEIKFTLLKFSELINSHPDFKNRNYDLQKIELELSKLIDEGLLSWMEIEGRKFKVYQVMGNVGSGNVSD